MCIRDRLKPDVKVSNAGDRPPRLGRDVVTFEDMREFLVAYLEYKQQCMSQMRMEETGCSRGGESW